MGSMARVGVWLDEQVHKLAKEAAQLRGISLAEFVRRAVRSSLPTTGECRWMRFAGMVETFDARSSRTIDAVIYGHKD